MTVHARRLRRPSISSKGRTYVRSRGEHWMETSDTRTLAGIRRRPFVVAEWRDTALRAGATGRRAHGASGSETGSTKLGCDGAPPTPVAVRHSRLRMSHEVWEAD